MKQKTNPTVNEVVESLKSVFKPIEGIDTSENNKDTAAIVIATDGDGIILFGAGNINTQAVLIAELLKRQPVLMLALMDAM